MLTNQSGSPAQERPPAATPASVLPAVGCSNSAAAEAAADRTHRPAGIPHNQLFEAAGQNVAVVIVVGELGIVIVVVGLAGIVAAAGSSGREGAFGGRC